KRIPMISGINLHRDINLLQVILAGSLKFFLTTPGIGTPIHCSQDDDECDDNKQFDEREGPDRPTAMGLHRERQGLWLCRAPRVFRPALHVISIQQSLSSRNEEL